MSNDFYGKWLEGLCPVISDSFRMAIGDTPATRGSRTQGLSPRSDESGGSSDLVCPTENPDGHLWWLSTENLSREAIDVTAVLDVIEDTIPEWARGGLTARL